MSRAATHRTNFALAAVARDRRLRFSLPAHRHADRLLVQRFRRWRISAAQPDPNWYRLLFADDAIWNSVLNSLLVAARGDGDLAGISVSPPPWLLIAPTSQAKRCFVGWFCCR